MSALFKIALHNLHAIHDSESESLGSKSFTDLNGKRLDNTDELIAMLLEHDLIETESDPNVYFLTTETYDLIEKDTLYEHLYYTLGVEEEYQKESPRRDRGLSYELIGAEEEKKKKGPYLSQGSRIIIPTVLMSIISAIYFFLPIDPPKSNPKSSPGTIEGLNEIQMIQDGDTLDLKDKQELMQ